MFDVFFISFGERLAEQHWEIVRARSPYAKWIANVQGIRKAHYKAAQQSKTEYFWVVDADSELVDDFNFDLKINRRQIASYFFHSRNPVNGLEYGHGGIKLLHKFSVLKTPAKYFDFTTSITEINTVIPVVASVNKFNETEFSTWRTAFRETVKLSSKLIQNQNDYETEQRLDVWLNQATGDFSEYCLLGARSGLDYSQKNRDSIESLSLINNYQWLEEKFILNS
jgi:hypothetical protein